MKTLAPLTLRRLNLWHCRQCLVRMNVNLSESPEGLKHAPNDQVSIAIVELRADQRKCQGYNGVVI